MLLQLIKKRIALALLLFTASTYPMTQPITQVTTHITEKTATLTRLTQELPQLIADLNALKEATENALAGNAEGLQHILQTLGIAIRENDINDQLGKRQQALDAIAALRVR